MGRRRLAETPGEAFSWAQDVEPGGNLSEAATAMDVPPRDISHFGRMFSPQTSATN